MHFYTRLINKDTSVFVMLLIGVHNYTMKTLHIIVKMIFSGRLNQEKKRNMNISLLILNLSQLLNPERNGQVYTRRKDSQRGGDDIQDLKHYQDSPSNGHPLENGNNNLEFLV